MSVTSTAAAAVTTTATAAAAIKTIAADLFHLLNFSPVKVDVSPSTDSLDLTITVDPSESGVLIGYHGETISSLQTVISLVAQKQLGTWQRLQLNVNDYRQKRQASLAEMAAAAAAKVKSSGEEAVLPPMSSFDRRLVHLALSGDPDISTESIGEGKDRRVVISSRRQPAP